MFRKSFMPVIPVLAVLLSGCQGMYKENFDCPVGTGMPCSSLSKVNNSIDKGTLKESKEETISQSNTFFGEEFLGAGGNTYA